MRSTPALVRRRPARAAAPCAPRGSLAALLAALLAACGETPAPGPAVPAGPAPAPVAAPADGPPAPRAPPASPVPPPPRARAEDARHARDVAVAAILGSRGDGPTVTRAVALLEAALEKTPDDLRLRVELADAYVATGVEGMIALAIDLYEEADAEAPDDGVRGRIVDAYERLGNADGATAAAARRLDRAPTATARAAAGLQAAWVGVACRRPAAVARLLATHADAHPDEPGLRFLVAVLEDAAGDGGAARATLDAVVRATTPDDGVGRAARAMRERVGR